MVTPGVAFTCIATGIIMASTAAHAGILISLRAVTVRQAQQTLGIGIMVLFFSPAIIIQFVPGTALQRIKLSIGLYDPQLIIGGVIIVFVTIDAALFMLASARFKRNRMLVS